MESTDQFATSKANLRQLVTWLATTVAAACALIVAGTPFSAFGTLALWSERFFVASGGLLVAAVCLFVAWLKLLRMLRSDAVFPSQLRSAYAQPADAGERREIEHLRQHLSDHYPDLLPTGIQSFSALETLVADEWRAANAAPGNAALLDRYKGYAANVEMILNYAAFERLRQRIDRNVPWVVGLTVTAALSLFAFAYAANPPKTESADRVIVLQAAAAPSGTTTAPMLLAPVRFAAGSARIDKAGLHAIEAARKFLREHDTAGLVLLAHTDTTGGEARNRNLAAQRGAAVRQLLLQQGGIAGSRVFVAELPSADLPSLTLARAPAADNRSVEFLVVTMPARK